MSYSSLFVGVTGLKAYGQNMQVIGNNLANVNTVGFKRSEAQFSDLMSTSAGTPGIEYTNGTVYSSQRGMGVSLSSILPNFEQGSFEGSTTSTDLGIEGKGFFRVVDPGDGSEYYTRAGVFRFDNSAYMVDPSGFRLQGYAVDRTTGETGTSSEDILLPYENVTLDDGTVARVVTSPPRATSEVQLAANLDSSEGELYTDAGNPFFAMLNSWEGDASNASEFTSANSSTIDIFDAEGERHTVTFHFDPVNSDDISNASGGQYWEVLVTMDPSEDGRAGVAGTSSAGLLAMGVLEFDQSGRILNQSMYSLTDTSDPKTLSNWSLASLSDEGVPQISLSFASSAGEAQTLSLDFGIHSDTASWTNVGSNATAASLGTNASNPVGMGEAERGQSYMTAWTGNGNATMFRAQDGYTEGYMQALNVDSDGYLVGQFSNGESERLYQVNLYNFVNEYGLRREGSNRFSATDESGAALEGAADEGGRGTVAGNSLEVSNVDMAEELADMILTQRAFQSNTKVVTTSDHIMNVALQTKR